MAARYYICPIIGDGKSHFTAFRPALVDIVDPVGGGLAFRSQQSCQLSHDPVNGHPLSDWVLVKADGAHAAADAVPGVIALPDIGRKAALPNKAALTARLRLFGLSAGDVTTQEQLLEKLGKQLHPDFDVSKF